jgi:ferredoxin-NADP reductase
VPPLRWRTAVTEEVRRETATAVTIVLRVEGWPGHAAGQHVDLRLTAPDGYTASRSYSIASAASGPGHDRVEVTVERVEDGEVSSYLTQDLQAGDALEVRGPVGGWFVWHPDQTGPLQLLAGGSGVVPLMAMLRTRAAAGSSAPTSLVYSTRSPESAIYRSEIDALAARGDGLSVTWAWTRQAPARAPTGRVDAALLAAATWPPADQPTCYVCGPTGFVEAVADLLVGAGHDASRVRTERFGPTGGTR